jgi:glycosyltransferase involved in cell wall biosynthesis
MKILLITNEVSTRNGWATVALALAEGLSESHRVTVLSERGDEANPGLDLISSMGLRTPLALRRDTLEIERRLGNEDFDVILCAVETHLPLAARLKRCLRVSRLVLLGHGTYIYYPFVCGAWCRFNRWTARAVDCLVVPSRFTAEKVRTWYRGALEVIPWGVDSQAYRPIMGCKKEAAFLFVGAQKPRKGVDDLLKGFARLAGEHPEARLYLVGQMNECYERRLVELGIDSQVIRTGIVSHDELLECYSRCLCHVLPSVNTENAFEGFGLVHLEANACGIPSIGALGTANEEIIEDGVSGLLCSPNDPDSVYRCMKRIISDETTTRRMFAKSRRHAGGYTWRRVIETLESKVLGADAVPGRACEQPCASVV